MTASPMIFSTVPPSRFDGLRHVIEVARKERLSASVSVVSRALGAGNVARRGLFERAPIPRLGSCPLVLFCGYEAAQAFHLPDPPPAEHRSGERADVRFHHRPAFEPGEGSTLQQIARSMDLDEEAAMNALLRAAAEGFVETNVVRWRAVARDEEGEAPAPSP